VIGSSIARATDSGTYVHVGPEIGVASTKAFTGQVTVMAMMALAIAERKGTVSKEYYDEVAQGLLSLPEKLKEVLELSGQVADLAKIFTYAHNFIYLGRGYNYPTALEGALKLKEITYIHGEGYAAGELKHGPLALIEDNIPVVGLLPPGPSYAKTYSNLQEIISRGADMIILGSKDDKQIDQIEDKLLFNPVIDEILAPLLYIIDLQLLAYYISVLKGIDPDKPKNLAKSVTVQ
jgi:glucosamine--fructose-6-phosphate aminotransferase (isomerizing)